MDPAVVRRQKPGAQSGDGNEKGGRDMREAEERKRKQATSDDSWRFYWPFWSAGLAFSTPVFIEDLGHMTEGKFGPLSCHLCPLPCPHQA